MILYDLVELSIFDILERGLPNKESIMLRVNQDVNLGQFGIMLGVRVPNTNSAIPIADNLFWFGDALVRENDWIFIYTGSGEKTSYKSQDGLNDIYVSYWGKPTTVMADHQIVPILFKIESVVLPQLPVNQPQLNALPR